MNILLLRGYNNYFNRIVKREETLDGYRNKSASYLDLANINFNPNDGITTEQVLGNEAQIEDNIPLNWENIGNPDYLVCYENNEIKSRWFVLDSTRTRLGQYRLSLTRDVLSEYYVEVMNAPCFVEKGTINSTTNPLLFNSEGGQYNQIKQSETLIKDKSNMAWLVGYMKKEANVPEFSAILDTPDYLHQEYLDYVDCINFQNLDGTSIPASKRLVTRTSTFLDLGMLVELTAVGIGIPEEMTLSLHPQSNNWYYETYLYRASQLQAPKPLIKTTKAINPFAFQDFGDMLDDVFKNNFFYGSQGYNYINQIKNYCGTQMDASLSLQWTPLIASISGYYFQYNNRIYQLSINSKSKDLEYDLPVTNPLSTEIISFTDMLCDAINTNELNMGNINLKVTYHPNNSDSPQIRLRERVFEYELLATEITSQDSMMISLPATRNHTKDLYDIFAIPFNTSIVDVQVYEQREGQDTPISNFDLNPDTSVFIAQQLMTKLGVSGQGAMGYDLQLLPYCPFPNVEFDKSINQLIIRGATSLNYTLVTDPNDLPINVILYPSETNFTTQTSLEFLNKGYIDHHVDTTNEVTFTRYQGQLISTNWHVDRMLSDEIISMEVYFNDILVEDAISISWDNAYYNFAIILPNNTTYNPTNAFQLNANVRVNLWFKRYEDLTPLELKIKNETTFERLVSPNFNGMFEFKISKLQDGLHYIDIDCTYKPISPYIKLNPDFSGLYGQDFNDATGLILGGDYSLSTLSDAWVNYELSNKNYQKIFDRQIQNMDINNQIAREQLNFKNWMGVGGAIGGTMGAIGMGAMKGGVGGAIAGGVGGVLGIGTSVANMMAQSNWQERQQREAKSYAIDMYNYNLGNIQALPQSISKSSPLSYNNKIWPILEEYSATDEEKEMLRNKIRYNGMTIMAIGTLGNYVGRLDDYTNKCFLKGQLIRLENVHDDYHVIDAIYQEVNKGFYVEV